MKPSIAIYLQHYLSPSMTFIYRQIKGVDSDFNPVVFSSFIKENIDLFPHSKLFFKPNRISQIFKGKFLRQIHNPHLKNSVRPELNYHQKKYFFEALKKYNVKLIHAHFGPSGLEVLPLARENRIPLVVTFHGYDASTLLANKYYVERLKDLFRDTFVITVSNQMLEDLITLGADKSRSFVIRCGIPLGKFTFKKRIPIREKVSNGELIKFLQVSNFVEKKGHKFTIQAFNSIRKRYPNTRLTLAGDGLLFQEIKKMVDEYNLNNCVYFPGKVNEDEVLKLMHQADVFLHHSITSSTGDKEGVPTVLMEAMSTGLPCISTFHSGIPELITDGVNGFLVNEKDVNGYADKIISLLQYDNNFAIQARKIVEEEFSLEKSLESLRLLYTKSIN